MRFGRRGAWAAALGLLTTMAGTGWGATLENRFPDSGFDQTGRRGLPKGWTAARSKQPGGKAAAQRDTSVGHLKPGSLKLSVTGPQSTNATSPSVTVKPATDYVVVMWYRAEGFGKKGYDGVNSQWNLQWLDAGGKGIGQVGSGFPYDAMDWQIGTRTVRSPKKAAAMKLTVAVSAQKNTMPSSLWIDDLKLLELPPSGEAVGKPWTFNVVRLHNHGIPHFRAVADDDAVEGQSAIAHTTHAAGAKNKYLTGGFYRRDVPPGLYRAVFRMKAAESGSDKRVAQLDINGGGGAWGVMNVRPLKARDFTAARKFQDIPLRFLLPPTKGLWVDFRAQWLGEVTTWLDTVTLVPEQTFSPNELQQMLSLAAAPKLGKPKPVPPELAGKGVTPGPLSAHLTPASKWPTQPAKVVKPVGSVTRKSYLNTVRFLFKKHYKNMKYWTAQPKPYGNTSFYLDGMRWLAFAYKATQDEKMAKLAVKCLEHASQLMAKPSSDPNIKVWQGSIRPMYRFAQWIAPSKAYTARHKRMLADLVRKAVPNCPDDLEYGVMNRTIGMASYAACAVKIVPDLPEKAKWRRYCDTVWKDWWQQRDTAESTGNYEALSFRYLVNWIDATGRAEEVYNDTKVQRYFERLLNHVFPVGSLPHYGDTNGWNVEWGHWIMMFELAAKYTQDGRFKWAAHRLYDYAVSHVENINSWAYIGDHCGESLMIAWMVADDSIQEVVPTNRLRAEVRPAVKLGTDGRGRTKESFQLQDTTMPDRLVMVGSLKPTATSLMLDGCPAMGHNPGFVTALTALVDKGSVLLMDSGYNDRLRTDHNLIYIEDYDGAPKLNHGLNAPGISWMERYASEKIAYGTSAELKQALYGRIDVDDYQNYRCRVTREALLAEGVGVLVRDTVTFRKDVKVRMGPVYNVGLIGPEAGPDWFNSTVGPWAGVRGVYANQPIMARWASPPRDLLVRFLPLGGATLEVLHRGAYEKTTPLAYRVQYVYRGRMSKGKPLSFATMLVPHAPQRKPGTLARKVKMQALPEGGCAATVPTGGETALLFINPAGKPVTVGPVTTDARFGVIRLKGNAVRTASLGQVSTARGGGLKPHDQAKRIDAFEHP